MFLFCWFDVTIKLMVDMGNMTTLMYCFDLVVRCEVGGWWLRILVSFFNVNMFIIWFTVRGVYNLLFEDLLSSCRLLFWNKHWSLVIYLMIFFEFLLAKKFLLLYRVFLSCLLISYVYLYICLGLSMKVEESFGFCPRAS